MKFTLITIFGIILLLIDQISKLMIRSLIPIGKIIKFIPGILSITNLQNTGAAWSILTGNSFLFIVISVIAIFIFGYLICEYYENYHYTIGLVLMLVGTIGNLIDRILFGYVTDMFQLDFINFPVFNVADSCLSVGVLIIIYSLVCKGK
ncbi:signal peptidase II [Fructilactobacillus lindneri]|uniref:Lipoprotein signal peptidase n=1 Tax=Fructilactobacillus lindneri TaxID=53444 RepID=A0AB33BD08_9LACO|nr:signal peptidase II [Fructilactobacillus lindneri]POH24933.1 signal peptidase II [Fructilactobacillus lindneri DSM 20690 = JCM 11027]ANZ59846.1 signal peptidase II [Fructilactobacillus lindneri]POG98923.1 signal peptidase II [Fructilactobacillus lindneri]POH04310.1 signal peptidase II [Fructilactobacillus lindneri]